MNIKNEYGPAIISAILLVAGLVLTFFNVEFFTNQIRIIWYFFAYIIVGGPVILRALKEIAKFDFANEFFLMSVATIGAFIIGEYAEGVAVMLFYEAGELLQNNAVRKARGNIKALLDLRPDKATVMPTTQRKTTPNIVNPGLSDPGNFMPI
ncbi:MAG: hypothetical protein ACFCUM_07645 [Bacteroidales bacterium]